MPVVRFTKHLRRYFPKLEDGVVVDGATVADVISGLEERYPGLSHYVRDERGALRKHVNVFVEGEMIADRRTLSDEVGPNDELHVIQALSGGR